MPARRLVLLLLLGLLVQPRLLAAQEPSIRGVVSDRQGGVVVGADVTLISEAGAIRTATTQTAGVFTFDDVRAGQYTLQVNSPGFASWSRVVRAGAESGDLMVTLDVAGLSETVGVVGTGVSTLSVPAPTATRLGITPLETPASLTIVTGETIRQRGDEFRILSPVDGEVLETGGPDDGFYLRVRMAGATSGPKHGRSPPTGPPAADSGGTGRAFPPGSRSFAGRC